MRTSVVSRDEARAELVRRGLTVREWAREHGVSERTVHEVLSGRNKGRYGQAHRAAVLLGVKEGVLK